MTSNWVVLKFGGTSVSGRPQWEVIASLLKDRLEQGHRVVLVCSAIAGVTNDLTALADEPSSKDKFARVVDRHRRLAADLDVPEAGWMEEAQATLRRNVDKLIRGEDCPARAELLSVGEWISTRIGAAFLSNFFPVTWVDVRQVLQAEGEPELSVARQWLSASCMPGLDPELVIRWEQLEPVVITQGFTAGTRDGRTALLGRGGSDTSAALLAGRLGAIELEIWTDVPGLFSADPRLIPHARLLMELDFDEALEMASSGAKVVHPHCIRAAATTHTPVVIRDTARPWLSGTRISEAATRAPENENRRRGVKAITCQKEMIVLLLQKIDIRREVGFLARVFEIFRHHGVSIDLVATSETTTTVSINQPANHLDATSLNELVGELQTQCTVTVYVDCICVNLVGNGVKTALARLQSALRFFDDHALLMLSQSASDRCLSWLVNAQDHEVLLKQAHDTLIPSDPEVSNGVFGARWQDIMDQA